MPSTKVHWLKTDDLRSILEPAKPGANIAGTKTVITLGPSSREVDTLVKLLEAGVTCVRVDLTYGSVDYHKQSLRNLETAVRKTRRICATVLDTFGRELVIRRRYEVNEKGWPKPQGTIEVKKGSEVLVVTDENEVAHDNILPIEYSNFESMCSVGDTLFVGRYLTNGADKSSVYLDVVKVAKGVVTCRAQNDASLDGLLTIIHSDKSSESMSSAQTSLPLLTHRDRRAIEDITKQFDIDYVALTYTCNAEDVLNLRGFLQSLGKSYIKVIAKVENQEALLNFEEIANEADVVLLSRGNLGLDVPPEKVAVVQKQAISRCNILGKPVIITRVVDTMTQAPRCTRAEATDIANAVLDGCDAILLGAETLRGSYPVEAVTTVLGICKQAEKVFNYNDHFDFLMQTALQDQSLDNLDSEGTSPTASSYDDNTGSEKAFFRSTSIGNNKPPRVPTPGPQQTQSLSRATSGVSISRAPSHAAAFSTVRDTPNLSAAEAMASTAVRAADKIQSKLIVCFGSSGRTAALVAKYRPPMPILCLVVPKLKSNTLSWTMEGRAVARQLLLVRGVIPVLSVPNIDCNNDWILGEALALAAKKGLLGVEDHVVCLMSIKGSLLLKIVSMDELNRGQVSKRQGSHNDLGVMATKAKEAVSTTDQNQIKSHPVGPSHTTESVPSRDTLKKASPQVEISNIDIKPKTEIPHIKLGSGGQAGQETTQNT